MTDQKNPETLADEDLDTVQGAGSGGGKVRLRDLTLTKVVDDTKSTQGASFIAFGNDGTGLKNGG